MTLDIGTTDDAFALGTFAAPGGQPFPGLVLRDGGVADLGAEAILDGERPCDAVRSLVERWEEAFPRLQALAGELGDGRAAVRGHALGELRVLPPLRPLQIWQSGANYRKHVIELNVNERGGRQSDAGAQALRAEAERIMDERAATGEPYVFLGAPSALCGAYDDVRLPADGEQHDWELELTAVLLRSHELAAGEDPGSLVAGYTISNDITTRDRVYRPDMRVIGTDWMRGKNAPTFLPTGPLFVPAAFLPEPSALRIELRVDGQLVQDESTGDMLFGVPRLVRHLLDHVAFDAGDLLLTGSPAGNGAQWGRFLHDGTVMEASITGLGTQSNRCVAAAGRRAGGA